MAYRQHDGPYYSQPQNTHQQNQYYDSPQQQYQQPAGHYQQPYQQPQRQETQYDQGYQHSQSGYKSEGYYDNQSTGHEQAWDGKSYQDSYAGSQTHLNPSGWDSQATIPPVPNVPYGFGPNYPPQRNGSGYSVVEEKMMKRRSVRKVELVQGNLVLDMPVPTHIVSSSRANEDEFSKMRYTAATCDPDDFARSKYSLRPFLYGRQTELFIVMTMYNEDEILFTKTMNAVIKNIAHLCSRDRSKMWGPEGWKKVVVNKRTLQVLSLMGVYQDGIAKDTVGGKDVTAHIFEYTSTVIATAAGEVSQGTCPVQIIFCLKEQNKKKLNSHRWFFNAFGPLIKPCFDKHSNVGGACGEICVDTGRGCSLLLTSPLAASQNFEYKMSNILDKPLESVFGYISVLPGAFSAYRYRALQNGPDGKGPLASYFKGETMHGGGVNGAGLFGIGETDIMVIFPADRSLQRNMYLAEDRILCFEIVTKKREGWILKYVKSAKAATDVPTSVDEFISQRRRWLNGSLFASIHATVFWFRIWTSGQNFFRKIVLQLEFIYNAVQLLFTWTSLANFYLAFFFLVSSATANANTDAFNFLSVGAGKDVFEVFLKLYIALLFVIVVCSLGNRPQGSKFTYIAAIILFGLCNVITLWCAAYTVYLSVSKVTLTEWKHFGTLLSTNTTFRDIVISLMATYGLYFIGSFMHLEPWHMFTSFIQYMFFLPSYVNILMMYAMCNLHDVTWGTKGDNGAQKDLGGANKVKDADGKEMMEVELLTQREDVDQLWNASRSALRVPPPQVKEHRDAATKQTDHDRNSRTNVVLAWVGTNMLMIVVFTSAAFTNFVAKHVTTTGNSQFNPYLQFLFFALAGLSAVRFTGSFLYLVFRLFGF
ncbi:unnamed protein product [Mycena citricolor]|uniref:Chitin synthase n=1 Tax=Mycena citricolor TaxID=2018698 RepID=A0AAD2K5R5_9AGAR|nr:unnamed protein product [Mycena citricolor]